MLYNFLLFFLVLPNSIGGSSLEHEMLVAKGAQDVKFQAHKIEAEENSSRPPTKPKFLTKKTKPFYVNGSKLPLLDFDPGESYAGELPIGNGGNRHLFFWFWPTTSPNNTATTIWLNGGPGASSFLGLLHENGPFTWKPGTDLPKKNPWSWSRATNMVWIEQPVGVGFTTGKVDITNETGVANEFNGFWKNFVNTFDLHYRKVYITGESYAGKYCPYIGAGMLKQNDKKYFNLKGMLIYDPTIGPSYDGTDLTWSRYNSIILGIDGPIQTRIDALDAKCGITDYINSLMKFPPPQKYGLKNRGFVSNKTCNPFGIALGSWVDMNPCLDYYNVLTQCPRLYDASHNNQAYFNRLDVKKLIHAPVDKRWHWIDGPVFTHDRDRSRQSAIGKNSVMAQVVEGTNNVLVGHGLQDFVLFSNDTLIALNNMTFNGARGFTEYPKKSVLVPYPRKDGGKYSDHPPILGEWTSARGLTFFTVKLSGHMVPQFQPRAAYRHLQVMLGDVPNLSSTTPVVSN